MTDAPRPKTGPGLWDWLIAIVLVGNLAWTTICLGGYLPSTMVVTAPLTAALVVLHLARVAWEGRRPHPAGWWLLPFLAYAAANVLRVAPVRWLGWHDWLFWAHLIGVFWVAVNELRDSSVQRFVRAAILALSALGAVLAFHQRLVDPDWLMLGRTQAEQFLGRASGFFGAPNSLAAVFLLVLPVTVLLAWRSRGRARPVYAVLAALQAAGLVLTVSRGAWLGLMLAATAWPLISSRHGILRRIALSIGVLAGFAAMVGILYVAMPTVRGRLDAMVRDSGERSRPILWRAAWAIFQTSPAFGSGAGTFNLLFEKHRPEHFQNEPRWAHNDYLNTLSDYGVTGFVLFFGGCAGVAVQSLVVARRRAVPGRLSAASDPDAQPHRERSDHVARGLALGLAAFGLQLFVDFHFKIPALAMLFATCSALLVRRVWPDVRAEPAGAPAEASGTWIPVPRAVAVAAALGCAAAAVLFVSPHYRAEAIRYDMRRRVDRLAREPQSREFERELVALARTEFARAAEIDPTNSQVWADRAYMTSVWSLHEPAATKALGVEAEGYATRGTVLAPIAPENWYRLGVALDMQGRWADAGPHFTKALRLAPSSSAAWYYQAYHLSLFPSFGGLAQAAVATSLRLDPNNRQAEDLRRRLTAPPR